MKTKYCISKKLLPLFDKYNWFSDQLLKEGYEDIFYYNKHLESFAQSEDELTLTRRITFELAKKDFWDDCILSGKAGNPAECTEAYEKGWLHTLLQEHREDLRREGQLDKALKISVLDLDPCRVREQQWAREAHENWCFIEIEMKNRALNFREKYWIEAMINIADEPAIIQTYITDQLISALGDTNFKRINPRNKNKVTISKKLSSDVELRFCVESARWSFSEFSRSWIGPDQIPTQTPNCLHLTLGLHVRGAGGRFKDAPHMLIPFERFAPFPVYGCYRNAAHIAGAIAGWMALYRMVAKEIESAAISCCDSNS